MATARFRELIRKYGKVALGVHLSVSAASVTGLHLAIKNNVDVESVFDRFGILSKNNSTETQFDSDGLMAPSYQISKPKKMNRMAELAGSSGGTLAVAILCNKALIPVRVPITIALTPPISRFLARRRIFGFSL